MVRTFLFRQIPLRHAPCLPTLGVPAQCWPNPRSPSVRKSLPSCVAHSAPEDVGLQTKIESHTVQLALPHLEIQSIMVIRLIVNCDVDDYCLEVPAREC